MDEPAAAVESHEPVQATAPVSSDAANNDTAPGEPEVQGAKVLPDRAAPTSEAGSDAAALAFAEAIYPIISGMLLDPLFAMVGTSYRCDDRGRLVFCGMKAGSGDPKPRMLVPAKVILYCLARTFPTLLTMELGAAADKVFHILIMLNAVVAMGMGVMAGMPGNVAQEPPIQVQNTAGVNPDAPYGTKKNGQPRRPPRNHTKTVPARDWMDSGGPGNGAS